MMRTRFFSCVGLLSLACTSAFASPAGAEVGYPAPTVQAVALHAEPLVALRSSNPAVVCVLDGRIGADPDINSALIGRRTVAGGSPVSWHAGMMASLIAAPINHWGMVGIAPGLVRILAVDIARPDGALESDAVSAGLDACVAAKRSGLNVVAVDLSLGTSEESPDMRDAVQRAFVGGVVTFASAGNDSTDAINYPAAEAPAISVGATDATSGALCGFSSGGLTARLLAPGCDSALGGIDAEDDHGIVGAIGTSNSAALAAGVYAALRARAPTLTGGQALGCVLGAQRVDVRAIFARCGVALPKPRRVRLSIHRWRTGARACEYGRRRGDRLWVRAYAGALRRHAFTRSTARSCLTVTARHWSLLGFVAIDAHHHQLASRTIRHTGEGSR